jgi:hypothetical protein
MIVLGIDHQRTHTAVCLREGPAPRWPPVSVGDGRRALIANAVAAGAWGGDALAQPADKRQWAGEDLSTTTWTEGLAFWTGLVRRVGLFLGGEPTSLRTVVVGDADGATGIREVLRGAGLGEPTTLRSGRAALAAALHGGELRAGEGAAVVAVVGDCSIEVFAYRVDWRAELPRVIAAARPVVIAATGAALWCREVVLAVRERCASSADSRDDAVLWPAAAEFGVRLASAEEAEMVEWIGPLSERMPAPVQFSRTDCRVWDSVARLRNQLPGALSYAARSVGGPGAPVLLAGPGARWPFAGEVAVVRTLDTPELAVARGAAWWTDLTESLFDSGLEDERTPGSVSAPGASDPGAPLGEPRVPLGDATNREPVAGDDWALLSEYVDHHASPGE